MPGYRHTRYSAWRAVRHRMGRFILVYRLAIDAEPCGVMVGLTENIQACLEDFQTGTPSMARKRHFASSARGLLCFCLMTLVTAGLIRSIRLIRGRNRPILWRTALQAAFVVCYLYRGRCPRLLRVVPSRHRSACGFFDVTIHPHRT